MVPGTEAFNAKMIQCVRIAGLYANQVNSRGSVPLEKPLNPTSLTTYLLTYSMEQSPS